MWFTAYFLFEILLTYFVYRIVTLSNFLKETGEEGEEGGLRRSTTRRKWWGSRINKIQTKKNGKLV